MDVLFLARLQFAIAAGFHFIFPPTTLGLSLIILILESLYLKTRDDLYKNISSFLIKILGVVFIMGTATGITLEFAFGSNWAEYSKAVGDVFGAPLAAEGVFAFFMESIFLGILVFGRKKVSEKMYWLAAFLVFLGSHLSGLWIIVANSFMQTPAGFVWTGKKAVLTNFFDAALNHSTLIRFIHTIVGGWITGSVLAAGISSWYILKNRFLPYAKKLLTIAVIVFIISGIGQLFLGHGHSVQVARTQPEKMAAFEGLWENTQGAPLSLFGIPDSENEKTHLMIGVPKMLSFLIYGDIDAEVKGLKSFKKEDRPPVFLSFATYHIMIMLGTLFVFMALFSGFLLMRKKLSENKWYLRLMLFAIPLPYIANETGWIAAEVGRQPWAVYHVLRTREAISRVVPAGQVLFSLIVFILIYTLFFLVFLKVVLKIVKKGPHEDRKTNQAQGG